MKVLHFAFGGGADNPYLPHNHLVNSVVYTGTHDNNTTLGWFHELDERTRAHVFDYLRWWTGANARVVGAGGICLGGAAGGHATCRMYWRWAVNIG
jgi:4-alpha-glucanotransferase